MFVVLVTTVILLCSQLGNAAVFLRHEIDLQGRSMGSQGTSQRKHNHTINYVFTRDDNTLEHNHHKLTLRLPTHPHISIFGDVIYLPTRIDALGRVCPESRGSHQWIGCV